MVIIDSKELKELLQQIQPYVSMHQWHGVALQNDESSNVYDTYIDMVPSDTVKYEVDNETGILY